MNIKQFLEDRKEMLLSMDKKKFLAYAKKYSVPIPATDGLFEISLHKARTGATDLPMAERSKSKRWLLERGYTSFDDGDVP